MKIIKEFKDFAVKGNMMDMAIGIIIGASFNKVIDVLVKNVFLPPLSLISETINIGNKEVVLKAGGNGVNKIAIDYGLFIQTFINFILIGIILFGVVKVLNRLKDKAEDVNDKSIKTPKEIQLLSDLTELIKEQNKLLNKK